MLRAMRSVFAAQSVAPEVVRNIMDKVTYTLGSREAAASPRTSAVSVVRSKLAARSRPVITFSRPSAS